MQYSLTQDVHGAELAIDSVEHEVLVMLEEAGVHHLKIDLDVPTDVTGSGLERDCGTCFSLFLGQELGYVQWSLRCQPTHQARDI